MYNTPSLAYSYYKYLSEHQCLDNKDQCKTKPWNLIGIGLGKVVPSRRLRAEELRLSNCGTGEDS